MNKKAIGYGRVSTGDQANHGISLEAQEESIRKYCEVRGLELVDVILEEGVSGGIHLSQRRKGKILLERMENEGIGNFVAVKLDRAFRSAIDALSQMEKFDKQGITAHFLDLQIDTASPAGRLMLSIMASVAEMERSLARERTVAVISHKKNNHKVYTHTPFGFDRVGDDLVENWDELEIVLEMRRWRRQEVSFRQICQRLEDRGIKTKTGNDVWQPTTVRGIINNDLYDQYEEETEEGRLTQNG